MFDYAFPQSYLQSISILSYAELAINVNHHVARLPVCVGRPMRGPSTR